MFPCVNKTASKETLPKFDKLNAYLVMLENISLKYYNKLNKDLKERFYWDSGNSKSATNYYFENVG